MKVPPPFSKEIIDYDTVHNDDEGIRSGFTPRQTITKCPDREPRRGLADFQTQDPDTKASGNPAHPEFRKKSDDGMPEFPAPFSKKSIKGGPARPGTPA
jgi:hypothetical protein